MTKYTLQIDGAAEYSADLTKPKTNTPIAYASVQDIPVPVRAKFVEIRKAGQSVDYIAELFNVPKDWVTLILEPPIGSSEH